MGVVKFSIDGKFLTKWRINYPFYQTIRCIFYAKKSGIYFGTKNDYHLVLKYISQFTIEILWQIFRKCLMTF